MGLLLGFVSTIEPIASFSRQTHKIRGQLQLLELNSCSRLATPPIITIDQMESKAKAKPERSSLAPTIPKLMNN